MLGEEAIVVDDDAEAFDLNVRRLQKKSGGGSVLNLIGSEDGNRHRELDGTGKLLVGDALSSGSDSTSLGRGPSFSGELLSSDQGVKDITEMIGAELNGLGTSKVKDFMFQFTCENPKCRAEMSISGTMMHDAALEDMRKKQKKKGFLSKFLGTDQISVGVECASCQRVHNLAVPDGVLG